MTENNNNNPADQPNQQPSNKQYQPNNQYQQDPGSFKAVARRWRFDTILVGLILIGIGVVLLMTTFYPEISLWYLLKTYWPLLIVAAGLVKIVQALSGSPSANSGFGWLIFAGIAIFFIAGIPWEELDTFGIRIPVNKTINTYKIADDAMLTVNASDCDVTIAGYAGDRVKVMRKTYLRGFRDRDADREDEYNFDVKETDAGLEIVVSRKDGTHWRGTPDVDLEISVPRDMKIVFTGQDSDLLLKRLSGEISARVVSGDLDTSRISGVLSAEVFDGEVDLYRHDAGVTLRGSELDVELVGVYGPIDIDVEQSEVSLDNRYDVNADITIKTTAYDIDIELPDTSDFNFFAQVELGSIRCDYDDVERRENKEMKQTFGDGEFNITLFTDRGTITLE